MDTIELLRQYKEENGLNYRELSERLDESYHVTYDLMNERRRFVDLKLLRKIRKLLEA